MLEHETHLLGDVHEAVVEHLEHDRVGVGGDALARTSCRRALEPELAAASRLRAPAGRDVRRRVRLDDQCGAVERGARAEVLAAAHRRLAPCAVDPDRPAHGRRSGSTRRRCYLLRDRLRGRDALGLEPLDDDRAARGVETEVPAVRVVECGDRVRDGGAGKPRHGERRVRAVDLEPRAADDRDPLRYDVLVEQLPPRLVRELGEDLGERVGRGILEPPLDPAAPERAHVREPHSVR